MRHSCGSRLHTSAARPAARAIQAEVELAQRLACGLGARCGHADRCPCAGGVTTYEAAERLVYSSVPTIHEAQQRRDAARGVRAVAGLHEQGTKARQHAATREKAAFRAKYEELVGRRPGLTSKILAIDGTRSAQHDPEVLDEGGSRMKPATGRVKSVNARLWHPWLRGGPQ